VLLPAIRKANLNDATQLASIAERTFRETFEASATREDMDLHCQTAYGESIQALELSDPDTFTLLSESEGEVIGFTQLHWGEAPACVTGTTPGEIRRFYVVADWHGKGVARDLMSASLEELRMHGSDVVWLGVFEHNPKAIAFYAKHGFAKVGDHVFVVGNDPQRDYIMMRPLT
jgi:diamine N-acetyltransferase